MKVRVTKKGYCNGPREPGEVFDMPLKKDGSEPTGSWFVKAEPKEAKPAGKGKSLGDEDLA